MNTFPTLGGDFANMVSYQIYFKLSLTKIWMAQVSMPLMHNIEDLISLKCQLPSYLGHVFVLVRRRVQNSLVQENVPGIMSFSSFPQLDER